MSATIRIKQWYHSSPFPPRSPIPACRYEKGAWTECTSGQMSRSDRLKTASDPTCQQTRDVTKNCNQGKSKADKKERPAKNKQDKGTSSCMVIDYGCRYGGG